MDLEHADLAKLWLTEYFGPAVQRLGVHVPRCIAEVVVPEINFCDQKIDLRRTE